MTTLRQDADAIVKASIQAVLPDAAVRRALEGQTFGEGRLILVAAGKAAWQMARSAAELLDGRIADGVVVTKYGHVLGPIAGVRCIEAGHPVPDDNSFAGTRIALKLTEHLTAADTVLFLLSGGGSALFEEPLIPKEELTALTEQLLACGADIVEINTLRKRMSAVKGGRFAEHCRPAQVYSIVLSDILGDPLDMIASGPAYPDHSTAAEAWAITEKYGLTLSAQARALLDTALPLELPNVRTVVTGSVRELCRAGAAACEALGYRPVLLTDRLDCEASEAGKLLGAIARTHAQDGPVAYLAGGETVVHLRGKGMGGRNQELALAAAEALRALPNVALFSVGSDGTDGPTDAAGGYVDAQTCLILDQCGIQTTQVLANNDAYHALERTQGLLLTGPTGTNVNDLTVLLIR